MGILTACLVAHFVGHIWLVVACFKRNMALGWLVLAPVVLPFGIVICLRAGVQIGGGTVVAALLLMGLANLVFLVFSLLNIGALWLPLLLFFGGDALFFQRGGYKVL